MSNRLYPHAVKRRVFFVASAFVVALGAVVACVGSDTTAAGEGAAGQPCYENGTCNTGLTCISHACVDLSAEGGADGSTPGADGSTLESDGSSDSGTGSDAGPPGPNDHHRTCAQLSSSQGGTSCPTLAKDLDCTEPQLGTACCPGSGCADSPFGCSVPAFACFSNIECPSTAPFCCVLGIRIHPTLDCASPEITLTDSSGDNVASFCSPQKCTDNSPEDLTACVPGGDAGVCNGTECTQSLIRLKGTDNLTYDRTLGICNKTDAGVEP